MPRSRIGHSFVVTGLLQCGPGEVLDTTKILRDLLEGAKLVQGISGVNGYEGPFMTLGQHDVFFQIFGSHLADMVQSFYALVDTLGQVNYASSGIRDFVKTIGFTWVTPEERPRAKMPTCHFFIKYQLPVDRRVHQGQLVIDKVISKVDRLVSSHQETASYVPYGHFSWHEASIALYGGSFDLASQVRDCICQMPEIWDVVAVPLLSTDQGGSATVDGPSPERIVSDFKTLLRGLPAETGDHREIAGTNVKFSSLLGAYSAEAEFSADVHGQAQQVLSDLASEGAISGIATMVHVPERTPPPRRSSFSRVTKPHSLLDPNPVDRLGANLRSIARQRDIVSRKLLAVQSQLRAIRANPQYRYVVPAGLDTAVAKLVSSGASEQVLEFYCREIRSALQQRLAGSGVGAHYGNVIGIFQRFGGYQKLVLACESLLLNCYKHYVAHVFGTKPELIAVPIFLVFFDYGLHYWTGTPHDVYKLGIRHNTPIVVRLPLMKYRPHLWFAGLRELANWMFYFFVMPPQEKKPFFEFELQEERQAFSDTFISSFISRADYSRLLVEEVGLFQDVGNGYFNVDFEVLRNLQRRLDALDPRAWMKHGSGDGVGHEEILALRDRYRSDLCSGKIVLNVDDRASFTALLSAYYGLDSEKQSSPKVSCAFVASLYWMHPAVSGG